MAKYALSSFVTGADQRQVLTTTLKTQIGITAATGATTRRKGWLYDVLMGCDQTPADNAIGWVIDRLTTAGTGTAQIAPPLDVGDAAALLTCAVGHTIEGTHTATTKLLEIGTNQRAGYRWVANPSCEFVIPATNVAGLSISALSPAYVGKVTCSCNFWE